MFVKFSKCFLPVCEASSCELVVKLSSKFIACSATEPKLASLPLGSKSKRQCHLLFGGVTMGTFYTKTNGILSIASQTYDRGMTALVGGNCQESNCFMDQAGLWRLSQQLSFQHQSTDGHFQNSFRLVQTG